MTPSTSDATHTDPRLIDGLVLALACDEVLSFYEQRGSEHAIEQLRSDPALGEVFSALSDAAD